MKILSAYVIPPVVPTARRINFNSAKNNDANFQKTYNITNCQKNHINKFDIVA